MESATPIKTKHNGAFAVSIELGKTVCIKAPKDKAIHITTASLASLAYLDKSANPSSTPALSVMFHIPQIDSDMYACHLTRDHLNSLLNQVVFPEQSLIVRLSKDSTTPMPESVPKVHLLGYYVDALTALPFATQPIRSAFEVITLGTNELVGKSCRYRLTNQPSDAPTTRTSHSDSDSDSSDDEGLASGDEIMADDDDDVDSRERNRKHAAVPNKFRYEYNNNNNNNNKYSKTNSVNYNEKPYPKPKQQQQQHQQQQHHHQQQQHKPPVKQTTNTTPAKQQPQQQQQQQQQQQPQRIVVPKAKMVKNPASATTPSKPAPTTTTPSKPAVSTPVPAPAKPVETTNTVSKNAHVLTADGKMITPDGRVLVRRKVVKSNPSTQAQTAPSTPVNGGSVKRKAMSNDSSDTTQPIKKLTKLNSSTDNKVVVQRKLIKK